MRTLTLIPLRFYVLALVVTLALHLVLHAGWIGSSECDPMPVTYQLASTHLDIPRICPLGVWCVP
jgi:hypothetical protein